jgi:excisionase family DNA binding protein
MPTYLTTAEAAARLGLSQEKIREYCQEGRLAGAFKQPGKGAWLIPENALPALGNEEQPESGPSAGDRFEVRDINQSTLAIGRGAQVTINRGMEAEELAQAFASVYQRIEARPPDPDVEKKEIAQTVEKIETEVVKGEGANPNKVERWLKTLAMMAPDILDVTVATLTSPAAGIAAVVRKVAERAKQEGGAS